MCPLLNSVQAWWITTLLPVSLSLGSAVFHWCLVRSLLELTDSWLVCWPWVGSLLSTASELVGGTGSELSSRLCQKKADQSFLHWLSWHDAELQILVSPACKWMAGKVVMQLETDEGSELPLTLFCVTHLSLTPVRVDTFWQLTSPRRERNRNWVRERETAYSKCMGFVQLCERGLFCV